MRKSYHIPYLHEINTSFAGTNFSLYQYHFLVQCSINQTHVSNRSRPLASRREINLTPTEQ